MVQSDAFFHGGFTALCRVLRHKTVCQWKLLNWFGVLHDCETALHVIFAHCKGRMYLLIPKGSLYNSITCSIRYFVFRKIKKQHLPIKLQQVSHVRRWSQSASFMLPCAVWAVTRPTWNKVSSQQFPQLCNAPCLIVTVAHKGDIRFGKVTRFSLEDADKWPFRCLFIGIYTE